MIFLDLLNRVARHAKPAHQDLSPIDSMETPFKDTEIDSLDGMMIVMYMAIIYGISDDDSKDFTPTTPQELLDFVEKFKTKSPDSFDLAMQEIM